jgi:hypothetical protein
MAKIIYLPLNLKQALTNPSSSYINSISTVKNNVDLKSGRRFLLKSAIFWGTERGT